MAKIFLSYRREGSAGYTGRIFDHLSARFGSGRAFMDADGIDAGKNSKSREVVGFATTHQQTPDLVGKAVVEGEPLSTHCLSASSPKTPTA